MATATADTAIETTRPGTFASLSVPTFRLLWLGGLASFLAMFSQMLARGWLARQLTGTNAGLGAVVWAYGITALITGPIGGVVVDRVARRTVLLATTTLLGLSSLWIGVMVETGDIRYWMLLAASAIQAVAFAGLMPARMAFTFETVGRDLVGNGIVLSQISMNVSQIAGPALAGALIGWRAVGVAGVYYVGAALSAISLVLFARLPIGRPTLDRPRRSPLNELRDGVRYAARHGSVGGLMLVSLTVTMIGFPYVTFLPTVADEFFGRGASGYAQLSALGAVGGLVASLFIARMATPASAPRIQTVAGAAFGFALVALSGTEAFGLAIAVIVVVGAGNAGFQSMNNTLIMAQTEPAYHGRMQSLASLGFALFGLAAWPLGWVADQIGLRPTLAAMGLVSAAVVGLYRARGLVVRRSAPRSVEAA